jgi:hypothetical protein
VRVLVAGQGTKKSKFEPPGEAITHDKRAIRRAFKTNGRLVAEKTCNLAIESN